MRSRTLGFARALGATWYITQRAKSAYTRGLLRARPWFSLRTQKRSSSTKSTLTPRSRQRFALRTRKGSSSTKRAR